MICISGWLPDGDQSLVSVRRIETYLASEEVAAVPPLESQDLTIALNNATVTWPQDRASGSSTPGATSTPRHTFVLIDLTLKFPVGRMSLICGRVRARVHSNTNKKTHFGHSWALERRYFSYVNFLFLSRPIHIDHFSLSASGRSWYFEWSSMLSTIASGRDCVIRRSYPPSGRLGNAWVVCVCTANSLVTQCIHTR